ncbi:MAG: phage virion morphogenesis protein [Armatimonadetes bacterium]|nr:phage virion morphogenesis protein [Armatimonadota bacterium]
MADAPTGQFVFLDVRFEVDGEAQISRRLNRMFRNVTDLRHVWPRIAGIIREAIDYQFQQSGEPPWPPLSPKYAARKRGLVGDKPILVFTGQLRASLTEAGHPDHIERHGPLRFELGTKRTTPRGNYNLGLIHHRGAPRANIPPRPIIRLLQRYKTEITLALREGIWEEPEEWQQY